MKTTTTRCSIFVTCLVDTFFPEVGIGMVEVLERLGVKLSFPSAQTCCGQPAYNAGYEHYARTAARRFVDLFGRDSDDVYIVCPSGSCAAMVKSLYGPLLEGDAGAVAAWESVACRTYEFTTFLVEVLGVEDVGAEFDGTVTYHDSCHAPRELGISDAPRRLLRSVRGVRLVESRLHDACCGFGGTFSLKLPHIAVAMAEEKAEALVASGADVVASTDMGCLMHLGGLIRRRGLPIRTMHVAELLASGPREGGKP